MLNIYGISRATKKPVPGAVITASFFRHRTPASKDYVMCGRFALALPPKSIAEHFQLDVIPAYGLRYNIAPTQPVVTIDTSGTKRQAVMRRWGLIPRWADDMKIGARMINARSETIAEKQAFRESFKHRRCLIPASGFFEWKRSGTSREPYYFRLNNGEPAAFAGLWDRWNGTEPSIESCTILTTAANEPVSALHDRMPVILAPDAFDRWLNTEAADITCLLPLLAPYPGELMERIRVGDIVNSAVNDDPRCIEQI